MPPFKSPKKKAAAPGKGAQPKTKKPKSSKPTNGKKPQVEEPQEAETGSDTALVVVEEVPDLTMKEFEHLEAKVREGLAGFIETAHALVQIRDGKGYRHRGFKTFADYVQATFAIGDRYARFLMASGQAATLAEQTVGEIPRSEYAARKLADAIGIKSDAPLPPEASEIINQIQEKLAQSGQTIGTATGEAIEEAAREVAPKTKKPKGAPEDDEEGDGAAPPPENEELGEGDGAAMPPDDDENAGGGGLIRDPGAELGRDDNDEEGGGAGRGQRGGPAEDGREKSLDEIQDEEESTCPLCHKRPDKFFREGKKWHCGACKQQVRVIVTDVV